MITPSASSPSGGFAFRQEPELELWLVGLNWTHVQFLAIPAGKESRRVSVLVGSGPTPRAAVRYPHDHSESGCTLGDDELDQQVRDRAAEELVRLHAATRQWA